MSFGDSTAYVGGRLRYTGDRYADFGNREPDGSIRKADEYTTVDLRAGAPARQLVGGALRQERDERARHQRHRRTGQFSRMAPSASERRAHGRSAFPSASGSDEGQAGAVSAIRNVSGRENSASLMSRLPSSVPALSRGRHRSQGTPRQPSACATGRASSASASSRSPRSDGHDRPTAADAARGLRTRRALARHRRREYGRRVETGMDPGSRRRTGSGTRHRLRHARAACEVRGSSRPRRSASAGS